MTLGSMARRGIIAASLCIGLPCVSGGQTWRIGPDSFSLRHPTLPSIQLTADPLPVLRFFETKDLTGTPAMALDSQGLKLDGTVICHWDGDGVARMLGVERAEGSLIRARGCPADLPIWSKVTDAGFGIPALLLGISGVEPPIGQIRFRNRTFYFDLRELPGDPNEERDPPPFSLPRKGNVGWEWLDSQQVDDAKVGRALAKKLEDIEYAKFYHGIRRCFLGRDYRCLDQYLHPEFTLEPWDHQSKPNVIGRRQFARMAWQTSLWQEVAWCFLRGRPVDDGMTFYRGFLECSVQRYGTSYGLIGCVAGE